MVGRKGATVLIDRDIQRGLDALEEGVLQLKRIAYVMEVIASNHGGFSSAGECTVCSCTLNPKGATICASCCGTVIGD